MVFFMVLFWSVQELPFALSLNITPVGDLRLIYNAKEKTGISHM